MKNIDVNKLTRIALIAAVYAVVTIILAPLSYGMIQVRISEALTVLPFIYPEAAIGLFIGCFIANIYGGNGIYDIIFGSLATLIAGYLTAKTKNKYLAPLPPVIVNALIIGFMLHKLFGFPLLTTMFYVGLGQTIACYGLGMPLLNYFLKKQK